MVRSVKQFRAGFRDLASDLNEIVAPCLVIRVNCTTVQAVKELTVISPLLGKEVLDERNFTEWRPMRM